MKLHVDGGLFTTSGYSSAGRKFLEAWLQEGYELSIRDIPIKADSPIKWHTPIIEKQGHPLADTDMVMMWGVPDLRGFYSPNPIPDGAKVAQFFSWEMNELPTLWKNYLSDVEYIFTPSQFSADSIIRSLPHMGNSTFVLPHGYDPKSYYYDEELQSKDDVFRVLYLGTWIKRKAPLETILSLIFGLIDTNSEIMIKLTYDDVNLARIIRAIQSNVMKLINIPESRLPKITILNGIATPEEMNSLLNFVDTVVLCSRGEAFGLPLLHAMATKTPILTTNQGGQMDYIPDDYEYLVKVNGLEPSSGEGYYSPQFGLLWHDIAFDQVQDKIREMYDSRENLPQVGEELYEAIKDLTWDKIAKYFKSVYDKYINNDNNQSKNKE